MDETVSAIRRFNRFFTQFVGALDTNFLDSGMSLPEARVLFELAHCDFCVASDVQARLDLDRAFVSRVLRRFESRGCLERARVESDGRRRAIVLTAAGQAQFEKLDGRQRLEVERVVARLDESGRRRVAAVLCSAQKLLQGDAAPGFILRSFRPGEMGLIASRQSVLYRERFRWNSSIEVNVGEVTAAFLRNFKPGREQCWVAEVDGVLAGSVFLTDEGGDLSRLRLLYVEPAYQGRGIGDALVSACVEFARSVGYSTMTLWTQSILESARRIYARHGFRLAHSEEHDMFGPVLLGETWMLQLEERVRNTAVATVP